LNFYFVENEVPFIPFQNYSEEFKLKKASIRFAIRLFMVGAIGFSQRDSFVRTNDPPDFVGML
jgi:hypothetical protein